jgi:hypothetical protein
MSQTLQHYQPYHPYVDGGLNVNIPLFGPDNDTLKTKMTQEFESFATSITSSSRLIDGQTNLT